VLKILSGSSLVDCDTVNMEAARSYEKFLSYHITTRCHNSEDRELNLYRRENLKTRKY